MLKAAKEDRTLSYDERQRDWEKEPRGWGTRIICLACVLGIAYLAYPYWCVYQLGEALKVGDEEHFDTAVNWPKVRESLKEEIGEVITASAVERISEQEEPGAKVGTALAMALMPAITDRFIDAFVSPRGLSRLIKNADARSDNQASGTSSFQKQNIFERIQFASFINPTRFRVDLTDADDPGGKRLKIYFELEDWTWRVTRLKLPH